MSAVLLEAYPDYPWEPSKFRENHRAGSFWRNTENQKKLMDQIALQLGINQVILAITSQILLITFIYK